MKAIILAAGAGIRINGTTLDQPKCLMRVGDETLLDRQLRLLKQVGIDDVTVVVGFQSDRVRQAAGSRCRFVDNDDFATTNSLFSLWLARESLKDGCLIMNSDVLFHPQLLNELLSCRYQDALLVSYCEDATPLGDEEMKVKVRRGKIVNISKSMDLSVTDGENVGIAKFGSMGAQVLAEEIEALIGARCLKSWAPHAFQRFATRRPLHAVSTRGLPWIEIDFAEDYRQAVEEIFPAIGESQIATDAMKGCPASPADSLTFSYRLSYKKSRPRARNTRTHQSRK